MKRFYYKAWNEAYDITKGIIEEDEINTAKDVLMGRGLNIIDLVEQKDIRDIFHVRAKFKDLELANFCGQLAIISSSGINVLKGLEVLKAQLKSKKLNPVVESLHAGVNRGFTLAKSMRDTNMFPDLLCDMIESGELSGNTDSMFYNMEDFYSRQGRLKEKMKAASIYPGMLLAVAVGMIFFFNSFIFPEIKTLFVDSKNLPLPTKLLLGSMDFLNANMLSIGIVIFFITGTFLYFKGNKKVKYYLDFIAIKNPVLKAIRLEMITGRFTRSMGLFLRSGVPILTILNSLKGVVGNAYVTTKIEAIKESITNGSTIADAINQEKLFEPIVIQMIQIGEESGKLEETLDKLADIYDKRSEATMAKLTALIEPVFTLVVGIFIAFLILAMAMPVMQMSTGLK